MTPERREFAEKRVVRLTEKLGRLTAALERQQMFKPRDIEAIMALQAAKRSTEQSIKRWAAELSKPG